MLARNETPGVKRRLRTGCLACRKRRRKCDEHRPSCENCVKRGAQCQYPGFTYVSIPAAAKSGYSSGNSSLFRSTNDDLDAGAAVQANDPSETGQVLVDALINGLASPTQQWQQSHSDPTTLSTNDQSHINLQPSQTTPVERYYQDVHLPLESTTLSTFQFGTKNTVSTTSSLSLDLHHAPHKPSLLASRSQVDPERALIPNDAFPSEPLQTTSPTSLAGSTLSTAARETALLCHFRYNLAPWLDINDCGAFFGVKLFLLARESRAVMAAILSIAARHLYLKNKSNVGSSDLECCLSYRQEAESTVFHETASIQQLVKMLLLLESFLRSNPQQWKDVVRQVVSPSDSVAFDIVEEPLRWVYFRIDLGAAILAGLPPLTPYHIWGAWRQASPSLQNPATVNMAPLSILACSLSLAYGRATESASGSQSMSLEHHLPLFGWTELWADCQTWYRRRPEELCPVLRCQAIEAGQIDPSSPASFPIELYSGVIALLPNVAYHLASLFLLSCKPRLVKPSADSKRAVSESWHMQSIAGIATRNDFREQWDPVLIAGLVHIGPRMTHESQQEALLSCLARASAATGLVLDHEIEALRSVWASGSGVTGRRAGRPC